MDHAQAKEVLDRLAHKSESPEIRQLAEALGVLIAKLETGIRQPKSPLSRGEPDRPEGFGR